VGSTFQRSFLKGIIWEFISFLLTLVLVFIVYGDFPTSLKFTLGLTIIKVPLFFFHERIWKKVRWGKLKDKK